MCEAEGDEGAAGAADGAEAVVQGVGPLTNTADESEEAGDDELTAAGAGAAKAPNGIGDGTSGADVAAGGTGAAGAAGDDVCVGSAGVSVAAPASSPPAASSAASLAASPSGGDGGGDGTAESNVWAGEVKRGGNAAHRAKGEASRETALAAQPSRELEAVVTGGEGIDGGGGDGGTECDVAAAATARSTVSRICTLSEWRAGPVTECGASTCARPMVSGKGAALARAAGGPPRTPLSGDWRRSARRNSTSRGSRTSCEM